MSSTTITHSNAAEIPPGKGLHDELVAYCSGKEVTVEGLHEIIVNRWGWSPDKKFDDDVFFLRLLCNEHFTVTEGTVKFILQYFPSAAFLKTGDKKTALHVMLLQNKFVTPQVVQILVDAFPQSVWIQDTNGVTPIHALCAATYHDESVKVDILDILLGSVGLHNNKVKLMKICTNNDLMLPIHFAALTKSTSATLMEKLIEACPRYVLSSTAEAGFTPLHCACYSNNLAVVEVLVKAYPKGLDIISKGREGNPLKGYPINIALRKAYEKNYMDKTKPYVDVVRFLVNYPGSKVAFQKHPGGYLPLHMACIGASRKWDGENRRWQRLVEAHHPTSLELVKILFDAFPGAIENSTLRRDMNMQRIERERKFHPKVMEFLNYHHVFTLPYSVLKEKYDTLPLHFAIRKNECLGSIKLLVRGNPDAVHIPYKNGAMPLHLAIQHHRCPEVIRYLVDKNTEETLGIADLEGNTALHLACRSAKCEIIAILLDKHGPVSVSKQNRKGKLPIELLLFETDADLDRQSTMYTDSIFRLVRAHPLVVMGTF